MSPAPSQKELLELEQSKTSPSTFLDAARSFLGHNFAAFEKDSGFENRDLTVRKSLAPREEFVLKLLLKRLVTVFDVQPEKFWFLLAYVIDTVPVQRLTQILGERDFFTSLDRALGKLLEAEFNEEQPLRSEVSSDEESGRPVKKRKLVEVLRFQDTSLDRILELIGQIFISLVRLTQSTAEVEDVSSNLVRNVLSASPEAAAAVVGKFLRLALAAISREGLSQPRKHLISSIPSVLSIWKYRRLDNVSNGNMSSDRCFTTECLKPALQITSKLNDEKNKSSEFKAVLNDLEILVALHCVLPLRLIFSGEKAQRWKANAGSITWADINDLYIVLGTMLLESASAESEFPQETSSSILQYYSIAVRAVPRPTIRRKQQEQPWLDYLFSVCAYLGEPGLPKMILDTANHIMVRDMPGQTPSEALSTFMERIFALVNQIDMKLSLPVLLYFMTATVERLPEHAAWLLMGSILNQDTNVLVPNSGLIDANVLLDKTFHAISTAESAKEELYQLVLDGIIRPLLKGFAQARDLRGFISCWLKGLQDSIQQRASGDLKDGEMRVSLVWEDDTLFQEFENTSRTLTASTLTQSVVAEMLSLLQQSPTRIGPTSDILSYVAIATALVRARPEDLNTAVLEGIVTATASALSRRSDYQLQRWRLCKLLRECYIVEKQSNFAREQLQRLDEQNVFLSLSVLPGLEESPQGYARDSRYREALECFHLTVLTAIQSQEPGKSSLSAELEHLIEFASKNSRLNTNDLPMSVAALSSCVGIILQYPQVLPLYASSTARLIAALALLSPSLDGRNNDGESAVRSLLLCEEVASNSEFFNDCCVALFESTHADALLFSRARNVFLFLPLQALKKSLAQKLADGLVKRLRIDPATASPLQGLLADLGLLEMVIRVSSVSVGKPKNWMEFVEVAEDVLSQVDAAASQSYKAALACITEMFCVLSRRCEVDAMSPDVSEGLSRFQSRLHQLNRPIESSPSASLDNFSKQKTGVNTDFLDPLADLSEIRTEQLDQIAAHINAQASGFGTEKSQVLAGFVEEAVPSGRSFLLISAVVCQTSAHELAQNPGLGQSLSTLATLQFALRAQTVPDLCLALETCKIILDKHTSVINQYTIDTLLSSITALTSSIVTNITSTDPFAIFTRLCSLLGLAFSHHRKRLGGRYHLLVPALQGLLRCLFFAGTSTPVPSQTKSQVLFIRNLPSWLRTSKSPLPPSASEHFTRLLSTICDPSASSVRSRKSSELTDQTKKAKSLAGQYMQYLLMAYCVCSLHGRIPSQSKEKLMPGMYSVMSVMDRELMRGMNGQMDSSSRVIFKGLYDEYQKFGRWDRK